MIDRRAGRPNCRLVRAVPRGRMEERVRGFYSEWGVLKTDDDVQMIALELAEPHALAAFNCKLRKRYFGTDLSSTLVKCVCACMCSRLQCVPVDASLSSKAPA